MARGGYLPIVDAHPEHTLLKKENEISTDTNNDYIIIFNDDSTTRVHRDVADKIMQASGTSVKFFTVNGNMINFSNIARMITIQEYYDQFPDERVQVDETPDYIKNADRSNKYYLGKQEFVRRALKIWEKQLVMRDGPGLGGLERLISWAELKLEKKKLFLELEAKLQISRDKEEQKKDRLAEIRKKREDKSLTDSLLA